MTESLRRHAVVVCPLLPFPPTGGGQKRTLRLLEAMACAGAIPHLITTDAREEGAAELRSRGWSVDVVPAPQASIRARARQHARRLPSPYLPAVGQRLRALVDGGCAFVQIEHTQSAYYARAIGRARCVLSLHNVDSELLRSIARQQRPLTPGWARAWNRWHAMRAVERRALPKADAVLCVSAADRDRLAGRAGRILLVPNGVDGELFDVEEGPVEEEDVLFFGQLDYEPNAHGLARFVRQTWPAIAAARPGAWLRVAGGGMSMALTALIERTERARALGFVPDLVRELAGARLVVVPLWQGGGTRLKVLESLAAARPVVGTPLGVAGIGFRHGQHGLTAADPPGLARATIALLEDPERLRAFGAEGRLLARGYRWERVTAPAERLYGQWLQDRISAAAAG